MNRRRSDVAVGAAVLLGILLIVFGTLYLKGDPFGAEERVVVARFIEVGSLLQGSTVKLRGVPIGAVDRIELEPAGGAVLVTMSVDADVQFPEDAAVLLAPESMFGDWHAEVVPRARFPQYNFLEAPDPQVLPGAALPDISRLTAVADEIAQNMKTLSDRVELAFTEETALQVRRAIENIGQVSEELSGLIEGQQRTFVDVAENLQTTARALEVTALTVQRTFAEAETAIGNGRLDRIMGNIESSSANADSLVNELLASTQELRAIAQRADTTFMAMGEITAAIERGEGTLGMLVRDTVLYRSLVESNIEMQALLADIRKNPRRYINLTIF